MKRNTQAPAEFEQALREFSVHPGQAHGRIAKGTKQTQDVLGPLRPVVYLVVPTASVTATTLIALGHTLLAIIPGTVVLLILMFYLAAYAWFAVKDPNRLQTEDFRLAEQRLSLLAEKSIPDEIAEDVIDVYATESETGATAVGSASASGVIDEVETSTRKKREGDGSKTPKKKPKDEG